MWARRGGGGDHRRRRRRLVQKCVGIKRLSSILTIYTTVHGHGTAKVDMRHGSLSS